MTVALKGNPLYGFTPRPQKKKRGQCEYHSQCSCYDPQSQICSDSTADARDYCGVYRRQSSEDTLGRQVRRVIDSLFELLDGPPSKDKRTPRA